ncbi:MAG: AMP-binding protein [Deltaproteobacteria bacterium]|nr:AMP-binding protein [Deltaproteobacteria bacterium]
MEAGKLTKSYYYSPGEITPGVTLGEYLERTVERFPDRRAFVLRERTVSWKELGQIVDRLALALIDLGISHGDKVAVLFPNRPEFIYATLTLAKLGVVHIPISERLREREIRFILDRTEAVGIIMVDEFWNFSFSDLLSEIKDDLPNLRHVIVSGKKKHPHETLLQDLINKDWEEVYPDDYYHRVYLNEHTVEPDDLLEIVFTSGTTGDPKGVMHTHNTRCRSALGTINGTRLTYEDTYLIMVPLSHTTALVNAFYASVISGSCGLLLETWNVEEAFKEIERNRATIPIGVPTMPIMMLQHPDMNKYDLSSLRTMALAGAPLPVEVAHQIIEKMGCYMTSAYGMTETAISNITSLDDPVEIVCSTVGKPQPGMEHKVVDKKGRIVPIGQEGDACARGQNVCVGYFKDPKRTADVIDDRGWIHSGDLAKMDEHGNLIIVGRIKDVIVRGGENISPTEIEDILYTYDKIEQVAVVGIPNDRLGEGTCACIIPKKGKTFTYDEMKANFKDKVARFKIPDRIEFMDEFPTTPSGKIRKVELREIMAKKIQSKKNP